MTSVSAEDNIRAFSEACIRCGLCTRCDCGNYGPDTPNLGDICDSILAGEMDWFHFAFTCSLCNRCTVRCPRQLKAAEASRWIRAYLIPQYSDLADKYRTTRGDMKYNLFTALDMQRTGKVGEFEIVQGQADLSDEANATAFFPGCTIGTYAPRLADAMAQWLRSQDIAARTLRLCCGSTVADNGLQADFEQYAAKVRTVLANLGIKRVVACCTHCLARLPELVGPDVEVVNFTTLLPSRNMDCHLDGSIVFHDACYDRFGNETGKTARSLFPDADIVELEHNLKNSCCCGGSGGVAAYAPAFATTRRDTRVAEISAASADRVLTCCDSCAETFQEQGIDAHHFLEYVFDEITNWDDVEAELDQLLSDPQMFMLITQTEDELLDEETITRVSQTQGN